ncbi:hypothetical protein VFPPC_15760 [Pochonia chlamydosporia 170]|uniref:Uncharacterized protein n=1 Tax=Pochonia chlamydosporia 170 TaxID=1380566 RepID=A0A179FS04_METCM|nr:hypothetical protein VFPPC_15760 [Pochonia chlamydosporia 170]OAQ67980.1 hypothetical protein VFPPC_15760 [Pochonia chlamydosporia 170]
MVLSNTLRWGMSSPSQLLHWKRCFMHRGLGCCCDYFTPIRKPMATMTGQLSLDELSFHRS